MLVENTERVLPMQNPGCSERQSDFRTSRRNLWGESLGRTCSVLNNYYNILALETCSEDLLCIAVELVS